MLALGVLAIGGVGAGWALDHVPLLGWPLYEPGASFLPVVAPWAALLALALGVARRGRGPAPILIFQSLLAFVALELVGAAAAYVINGMADRSPASAVTYRITEFAYGRSGLHGRLTPAPGARAAPDLSVPVRLLGGSRHPPAGATVVVHVRPGALGLPWIDRYEVPTP